MPCYKYEKIITTGPAGTILAHQSTEENKIEMLGYINGFVYIKADALVEQHEDLVFTEIVLSDIEKTELKNQKYIQNKKLNARNEIRKVKDFEDDLTDQKILIQFLARGLVGVYSVLTDEQKANLPYKENFEIFAAAVTANNVRLDKEEDQVQRVMKIIQDEVTFADIAEEEYLSKK